MKLDLPVPLINVICQGLLCLQQQTAVTLAEINEQVAAQHEPPPEPSEEAS